MPTLPNQHTAIIAVAIPTFKRKACVEKLVSQLLAQQLNGIQLEIVITVDGDLDGTWQMLQTRFPQVHKVLGNGNWFFTRGVNEAFKYAEKHLNPDYGLILNDDLEIKPNYIQTLYNDLQQVDARQSLMGSATLTTDTPARVFFAGTRKIIRWRFKSINYVPVLSAFNEETFHGIRPSASLPGRGTLAAFSILKKLDYLDERFPQYASDDDFCFRALQQGYKVYVSLNARVYSHIDQTGVGASYIRYPFSVFIKSLFNPYSSQHIPTALRMLYRHGNKWLFPIAMFIAIAGKFKAYFFNKKHF